MAPKSTSQHGRALQAAGARCAWGGGGPRVMLPQLITGCKLWHLRGVRQLLPPRPPGSARDFSRTAARGRRRAAKTRLLRHPQRFFRHASLKVSHGVVAGDLHVRGDRLPGGAAAGRLTSSSTRTCRPPCHVLADIYMQARQLLFLQNCSSATAHVT